MENTQIITFSVELTTINKKASQIDNEAAANNIKHAIAAAFEHCDDLHVRNINIKNFLM